MWDVIGLGANSVDFVARLPTCPGPSAELSKLRISSHHILCGGQAATTLAVCAKFGLRTSYVGVLGSDDNGRRAREAMTERGIDLTHAVVHEGFNQFAVVLIADDTGERIVLWDRDDRLLLDESEVPREVFQATRVLFVDSVDEAAAIRGARIAREAGVVVTSDIDRVTPRTLELVEAVTVPIFAEHVPLELTGEPEPVAALRKLRARNSGLLCVTLGAGGAVALEGDCAHRSSGFKVVPVDTTGAGDAFRGGFIFGLLQEWPVECLLRFANASAALSCTKLGAMNSAPELAEVRRLAGIE